MWNGNDFVCAFMHLSFKKKRKDLKLVFKIRKHLGSTLEAKIFSELLFRITCILIVCLRCTSYYYSNNKYNKLVAQALCY